MNSVKCARCGMVGWATAETCKGCGAAFGDSAPTPSSRPAASFSQMRRERAPEQGGVVNSCIRCGEEFRVKRWDSWNGFLVECPHCGGLHGKRWNIRRVLLASFVFHAFSLLFTMRPAKSLPALAAFIALGVGGNFLLDSESVPDSLEMGGVILFVFAPMLINAAVLVMHERGLDSSAESARPART